MLNWLLRTDESARISGSSSTVRMRQPSARTLSSVSRPAAHPRLITSQRYRFGYPQPRQRRQRPCIGRLGAVTEPGASGRCRTDQAENSPGGSPGGCGRRPYWRRRRARSTNTRPHSVIRVRRECPSVAAPMCPRQRFGVAVAPGQGVVRTAPPMSAGVCGDASTCAYELRSGYRWMRRTLAEPSCTHP